MTRNDKPVTDAGYTVGVNPDTAFTVYHDDGTGRLIFAVEVDDTPKTIYLNPRPFQDGRAVDPTTASVRLAIDRLKVYFEGQGLTVVIDK